MRLDVFLKRVGLVKQRSSAKTICDKGRVSVDGREAKAGREIAPGRIIGLELSQEFLEIEVVGLPERSHKRKEGEIFYRVINHERKTAFL